MTFDPFGDFSFRGYLRNLQGEKDLSKVRVLEHFAFLDQLEEALAHLRSLDRLTYGDVLEVHRILFGSFYPWAGQDRAQTAPHLAIRKGPVLFAPPGQARRAVEYALLRGQDREFMVRRPGEVMGYLAYGHPFLEGNGRTLMTVHAELAQRANFSLDWPQADADDYLSALTRELGGAREGSPG